MKAPVKLEDATEEQIEAELKRRRELEVPKPRLEMSFEPLIDELKKLVQRKARGTLREGYESEIFETAVGCVYDHKDFWLWWNLQ